MKHTPKLVRQNIETNEGHTIGVFYNPDTRLLVVDVVHKNEQVGNEILRRNLNFGKLLAHV